MVARRAAAFLIDAALLGMIGLVAFAALRYRSYTGVPANACTVLTKNASNAIINQRIGNAEGLSLEGYQRRWFGRGIQGLRRQAWSHSR